MFASQIESIKENRAWGIEPAIDSLPKLMELAQAMAHNDQICYIDRSNFTAFISKQTNEQIAAKIKSERAPLNWFGEPKSDEERIASEQRKLPIEGYIEGARPFIEFILSCNNNNLRKRHYLDTLEEYASNSFLSKLSKNFSKTLSILAHCTEIGKLVFVETLGLNFLFKYTSRKFEDHMFLRLTLPTIGVGPRSIRLGTIDFDLNPVNTFILPFHYIARNFGKLVGFTVGLLTTMVLSPFVLLKSVHEARTAQNRLQNDINESDRQRKESLDAYINHLPNILVTINDDNADDFYTLYKNLFSQYPTYTQKMLDDIAKKAKECNKSVYYLLGTLYQDLGMNDEACQSYSQMDQTHHAYMECMFQCGNYAYANRHYSAASIYFKAAISAVGEGDQKPPQTVDDCKKLLQAVDAAIAGSRQAASLQVIEQPSVGVASVGVASVPGTTFYRSPVPETQVDASLTLVKSPSFII